MVERFVVEVYFQTPNNTAPAEADLGDLEDIIADPLQYLRYSYLW